MTTFSRICIRDFSVTDSVGQIATVERGKEYCTSAVRPNGAVMVFGAFWWPCPVEHFAGEVPFT